PVSGFWPSGARCGVGSSPCRQAAPRLPSDEHPCDPRPAPAGLAHGRGTACEPSRACTQLGNSLVAGSRRPRGRRPDPGGAAGACARRRLDGRCSLAGPGLRFGSPIRECAPEHREPPELLPLSERQRFPQSDGHRRAHVHHGRAAGIARADAERLLRHVRSR
ncbi:hypothetical protein OY671_011405, partial [Metschnikowia pulcherrima]